MPKSWLYVLLSHFPIVEFKYNTKVIDPTRVVAFVDAKSSNLDLITYHHSDELTHHLLPL